MAIYLSSANNEFSRKLLGRFLADRFNQIIAIETNHIRLSLYVHHTWGIYLREMPGQCGVLVAYNLPEPLKTVVEMVEIIAGILQYKTVMVSHRAGSHKLSCWLDAGYEPIWENKNLHSGNTIMVLVRDLGDPSDEFCAIARKIYNYS